MVTAPTIIAMTKPRYPYLSSDESDPADEWIRKHKKNKLWGVTVMEFKAAITIKKRKVTKEKEKAAKAD